MSADLPRFTDVFIFGFTLWLAAYLLARGSQKQAVRLAGLGLLAYALAFGLQVGADQFVLLLMLLPAVFWIGAAISLLPEETPPRPALLRAWAVASVPAAILALLNAWFAALIVAALFACAVLVARLALRARFRNPLALLAVVALFVPLSAGLLILPLEWIPRAWASPLLGFDLLLFGLALTYWDAFDEGENLRAHLLRSFVAALYSSGALALIVLLFSQNRALLLGVIAFGILTQTFSDSIQSLLDRLTLAPAVNDQRNLMRAAADALPRLASLEAGEADPERFARLTRRALSHLGDLPKLAASPLTNLPGVQGNNPLERAQSLKSLLARSIQKLKPQTGAEFGVGDEWRHYNALHFPYVLGLKPYARRLEHEALDAAARAALDWFQTSVPERTLHNWQNAAAKLIAEDLKNQNWQ